MRILVNALPLRFGGGVTYLRRQMQALATVRPDWCFHTLLSPWTEGLEDLPGTLERVRLPSVPMRAVYEQSVLPMRKADVLYCPTNFGPIFHRAPMVLTVHNANYYGTGLALPETRPSRPRSKVIANHLAMRRSDVVVAISRSLADEIRKTLPGLRSVQVIPSGSSDWDTPAQAIAGLPQRFIVVVGSRGPHKRVGESIAGWALSLDRDPCGAADLVVVGPLSDHDRSACIAAAGDHASRLHFTGQLGARGQMRWIYENALALVSSSILEAFPLTPGEAGSVGCPLVLSDIPAHREVTQGRGHFVDPGNIDQLASVLAAEIYPGTADRTPWVWDVTWEANAQAFAEIFESQVSK